GAGDRGVFLVQDADGGGGEQVVDDAFVVRFRAEAQVVVTDGGHDAGGAVGGRGDHAAAGGVFFVDGERVEVDPVEDGQRVAQRGFGLVAQILEHRRGTARHLQATGQGTGRAQAAGDAIGHRLPDRQQ